MTISVLSQPISFAGQEVGAGVFFFSGSIPFAGQYAGAPLSEAISFPSSPDGVSSVIYKGDDSALVRFLYGSKVSIRLDMESEVDSRGIVQWLDNGKDGDTYSGIVTVETEDGEGFENLIVDDSGDQMYFTTPITNGFYPFGMGFETNQDYPVVIDRTPSGKNVDLYRNVRQYKLSYSFATPDIYNSIIESTTINDRGCSVDHWQIESMPFPFAEFKDVLNFRPKTVGMRGWTSEIIDTTRIYGDVSSVKLSCGEEQARRILQFFTGTMRGTTKTMTMPAIYDVFGKRYAGLTSAQVQLASERIDIEHRDWDNVVIKFQLQIVGE